MYLYKFTQIELCGLVSCIIIIANVSMVISLHNYNNNIQAFIILFSPLVTTVSLERETYSVLEESQNISLTIVRKGDLISSTRVLFATHEHTATG